jgi:nucleoside-diphosphate-sugar epimerase
MNKSQILIAGCSGYIGANLYLKAAQNNKVIGLSRSGKDGLIKFDLSNPELFDYTSISENDVVVIASAISAPNICSDQFKYAYDINVVKTSYFISRIIASGGKVIFLSSDTVYGSGKGFSEMSDINPVGDYAKMKQEVECMFLSSSSFKSVRLSYVFSLEDKFTSYLKACASDNQVAEIFHPFCRSVVHLNDVVDGLMALSSNWGAHPERIFNFGGPQVISRVDMASTIQKLALSNLVFEALEPGSTFFTQRPKIIEMKSNLLAGLLGRQPRSFNDAVVIEFNFLGYR